MGDEQRVSCRSSSRKAATTSRPAPTSARTLFP